MASAELGIVQFVAERFDPGDEINGNGLQNSSQPHFADTVYSLYTFKSEVIFIKMLNSIAVEVWLRGLLN